jgi:WD40 repeat protein
LLAACRLFETEDGISLHEVRLWDVTSGRLVKALDRCHGFDFSPDSRQLAIISRTKCVIYDLDDWAKEKSVPPLGGAVSITFAANGLSLVAIVRDDAKYRMRQAAIESTESFSPSLVLDQPFYRVAAAPDGSLLATGHEEGHVLLWDPATLDLKSRMQTGERGVAHPFFSPDAQLLAAGSQATGDVVIWNLADRQEVARYTFEKGSFRPFYNRAAGATFRPERDPTRFCFSPNGDSFLAGCYGGILRATRGGQEIARFGE